MLICQASYLCKLYVCSRGEFTAIRDFVFLIILLCACNYVTVIGCFRTKYRAYKITVLVCFRSSKFIHGLYMSAELPKVY
uniref:Uncharacterized protein n=1 Tax=Physcomitrium patens TaxID=3218 RepID=A0A2K1K266_PHYPA|nr:hypothetical protein PHYPA_012335 [Physcomitrium patens]